MIHFPLLNMLTVVRYILMSNLATVNTQLGENIHIRYQKDSANSNRMGLHNEFISKYSKLYNKIHLKYKLKPLITRHTLQGSIDISNK